MNLPPHETLYRLVAQLLELPLVSQPNLLVPLGRVTQVDVIVDQDFGIFGDILGSS